MNYMVKPGPKPINSDALKGSAQSWATFFYSLRDGEPGVGQRVKWGDWEEWHGVAKLGPDEIAQLSNQPDGKLRIRKAKRILAINLINLDTPIESQDKILRALKTRDDLVVSMLVPPSQELWQEFRDARTITKHLRAASQIADWWKGRYGTGGGSQHPVGVLATAGDELALLASRALFNAKKLWLYPRASEAERSTSDDKRIEFFAKAAAGLVYGIAPATALRKLTGVRFRRDSVEKARRAFVKRIKTEIKAKKVTNEPRS